MDAPSNIKIRLTADKLMRGLTKKQLENVLTDFEKNYPEAFDYLRNKAESVDIFKKGIKDNMLMIINKIKHDHPEWYTADWVKLNDIREYVEDLIQQQVFNNTLTRQLNEYGLIQEKIYKPVSYGNRTMTLTFVKLKTPPEYY